MHHVFVFSQRNLTLVKLYGAIDYSHSIINKPIFLFKFIELFTASLPDTMKNTMFRNCSQSPLKIADSTRHTARYVTVLALTSKCISSCSCRQWTTANRLLAWIFPFDPNIRMRLLLDLSKTRRASRSQFPVWRAAAVPA
jgi:hypothetical protein